MVQQSFDHKWRGLDREAEVLVRGHYSDLTNQYLADYTDGLWQPLTTGNSQAMDIQSINDLLQRAFPDSEVEAGFEGSHLQVAIVSKAFAGLTPLKRQQKVYAVLNDRIASGEIHAVNMKLSTP